MPLRHAQLKEYFAPIAKSADLVASNYGVPGLMYPGTGLQYDDLTGEVDAIIPARPRFVGLIGPVRQPREYLGPYMGTADDPRDEVNPIWSAPMVVSTTGYEKEGDYYLVTAPAIILNDSWGFASGAVVNLGDTLIKVRHGDASEYGPDGNWEIMPSYNGYVAISSLRSKTQALVIDMETDRKFPDISVLDAVPPSAEVEGFSGLLNRDDKLFIDNVPTTYTNQDFTIYAPITDDEDQ